MSADREEFEAIADRLRAEAAELRYAELHEAIDEHVQLIVAGLAEGAPFSNYQLTAKRMKDVLAAQEDWPALMALSMTNVELLAAALVQLAELWRARTVD